MKKIMILLICVFAIGCTDAEQAKIGGLRSEHSITCYSGGLKIYDGVSTGKILSEEGSDGYYFYEKGTKRLVEVSGNCIILRLE